MSRKLMPLWRCPLCGERFVTRNLWHSCGKFILKAHFTRYQPLVFGIFRKFARVVRACGPVRMIPQKTRIVFQARVRFAGCHVRKSHLLCRVALPERCLHPRFTKIARFHGHYFPVHSEKELDAEVRRWIRASYAVGQQKTLLPRAPAARRKR